MDGLLILLAIIAGLNGVLVVGGIVADYILPRISAYRRWEDSVCAWDDADE